MRLLRLLPLPQYFNSIKVRLELYNLFPHYLLLGRFQFHKGAIRTSKSGLNPLWRYLFQFHKGAIRTVGQIAPHPPRFISIP